MSVEKEQCMKRVKELESQFGKITLKKSLVNPHPLILKVDKNLKENPFSGSWEFPELLISGRGFLNMKITEATKNRALIFYDQLIKIIEQLNYRIYTQYSSTYFDISGATAEISLRELYKLDQNASRRIMKPTGQLCLKLAYVDKEWKDSSSNNLEANLYHIIAYMESYAAKLLATWKRNEDQRALKAKEKEDLEKIAAIKEMERNKFNGLLDKVQRWKQSILIKEYLEAHKDQINLDEKAWIEQKINWIDPFTDSEDPILGSYSSLP